MTENIYNTNHPDDGNQVGKGSVYQKTKYPKNVRQIGKIGDSFKIYVEDYVNTYTKQIAERDPSERCAAVLIGEYRSLEGERDVFIYGAIELRNACADGRVCFTEEVWTNVYEVIKQYFPEGEIVGWYFGGTGFGSEESSMLKQVHIDNFAGRDKVLLTYDFLEREENFYLYESGVMLLQPGYYIYYEKNTEMQNYMVDHKHTKSEELMVDNHTVNQIRAKLEEKKKPEMSEKEQRSVLRLAYTAGTLMILVALVVGITVMNNNEKMKDLEQALNTITNSLSAEKETENKNAENAEDTESGNIFELGDDEAAVAVSNNQKNPLTITPSAETGEDLMAETEDNGEKENSSETSSNEAEPSPVVTPVADGNEDEKKGTEGQTEEENQEQTENTESKEETELTGDNESTETTAVDPSKLRIYIVKEGDTIAGICRTLYGNYDNVQLITELNQLVDENKIMIGQELLVP